MYLDISIFAKNENELQSLINKSHVPGYQYFCQNENELQSLIKNLRIFSQDKGRYVELKNELYSL